MNEQEILYGLTAFIAGVVGADDESAGKDGSALRTFSRQERSRCIFIFYTVFSFNYLRLFSFPPCRLRWRRGEQGGINQNQEKFVWSVWESTAVDAGTSDGPFADEY